MKENTGLNRAGNCDIPLDTGPVPTFLIHTLVTSSLFQLTVEQWLEHISDQIKSFKFMQKTVYAHESVQVPIGTEIVL